MVYIVMVSFIGVSNLVGRFNKYDCIEYNTDTGALLFCNGCYFQLALSISSYTTDATSWAEYAYPSGSQESLPSF